MYYLEVNSKVEVECAVATCIVVIVTDVGETNVVVHVKVEHAETYATANAKTTIEAFEALHSIFVFAKGTNLGVRIVIFDIST